MSDPGIRLIAISAVLAGAAALLFWAINGADGARLPVVLLGGAAAAILAFVGPLLLIRQWGIPYEAPPSLAIGTAAWALAIGVGSGWAAQDVLGLVVGCSVIAFLLERVRRASAR